MIGVFSSHNVSPVVASLSLATAAMSPTETKPAGFCFFPTQVEYLADPLLLILLCIQYHAVGVQLAGVDPEEGQFAGKRVRFMVLKIKALNGSEALIFLVIGWSFRPTPSTVTFERGAGKYKATASRRRLAPMFFNP